MVKVKYLGVILIFYLAFSFVKAGGDDDDDDDEDFEDIEISSAFVSKEYYYKNAKNNKELKIDFESTNRLEGRLDRYLFVFLNDEYDTDRLYLWL